MTKGYENITTRNNFSHKNLKKSKLISPSILYINQLFLAGCRTNSARCKHYPVQYWCITRFRINVQILFLIIVINVYVNFHNSSLEKITICRICFLKRQIEQLGSISFRVKFQKWHHNSIFFPELYCGNLHKDAVMKISPYSGRGYLTLYRTKSNIEGTIPLERLYIDNVTTGRVFCSMKFDAHRFEEEHQSHFVLLY